jgi:SAM-dependent methyltransferase
VDLRRFAPATARNREPIQAVLSRVIPPDARVLEIGSGSGEHAVHFAEALPGVDWQPTDPDPTALESITAWRETTGLGNVRPALALDVATDPWPSGPFDVVVCINVVHISPWATTLALAAGASRVLTSSGRVVLYGPYKLEGRHTAPSNEAFDEDLRRRDPRWGVRDLADVAGAFAEHGFRLLERVEMPANNQTVVFARG